MAIISRSRKIRPSTRAVQSTSYRIHCDRVTVNDILQITTTHEKDLPLRMVFQITGRELAGRNNIHFEPIYNNGQWIINWTPGVEPTRIH